MHSSVECIASYHNPDLSSLTLFSICAAVKQYMCAHSRFTRRDPLQIVFEENYFLGFDFVVFQLHLYLNVLFHLVLTSKAALQDLNALEVPGQRTCKSCIC
jgi:hypothetical protein